MKFATRLLGEGGADKLNRFLGGVRDDYGIGREDWQQAMYDAQDRKGLGKEMPKVSSLMATHPTANRVRQVTGIDIDPDYKRAQEAAGLGLSEDPYRRAGQVIGTMGADITQDATRALWWLVNAPQAAAEMVQEYATMKSNKAGGNKSLYGKSTVANPATGEPITRGQNKLAEEMGLVRNVNGKLKPVAGVNINNQGQYEKRNYAPGAIQALSIPTGIAVNNSLGLLTPFGGSEGYMAVVPSEEDPTKTDNLLAEIGTKYILGRTGGLLPYDEFVKVRPDVSPEEYGRYQGYRYNKNVDLNPLDGDFNLPGVIRATDEGIHGPEVQFLGKSIPATTGLVPIASAIAGTALGARRKNPLRGALVGGFGGLGAGTAVGSLLEAERRRRNAEENGIQL